MDMRIEQNPDGTYAKRLSDVEYRILTLIYNEQNNISNGNNLLQYQVNQLTMELFDLRTLITLLQNGGAHPGGGFIGNLEELHNLVLITAPATTVIAIGIATFDRTEDILEVYHENLRLYEDDQWVYSVDGKSIVLQDYVLGIGDKVMFYVVQGEKLTSGEPGGGGGVPGGTGLISNLEVLRNLVLITEANTTTIPIGISAYDRNHDLIEVYHENLRLYEDDQWVFSADSHSIVLQGFTMGIGDKIMFYVVQGKEVVSTGGLIGNLEELQNLVTITVANTSIIPIGIPAFNRVDDVLEVYYENLRLYQNDQWVFGIDNVSISLQGFTLNIGEKIMFYVLQGAQLEDVGSIAMILLDSITNLPAASIGNRSRLALVRGTLGTPFIATLTLLEGLSTSTAITLYFGPDTPANTIHTVGLLVASNNTPALLAQSIRALNFSSYPDWTIGGTGNTITFTTMIAQPTVTFFGVFPDVGSVASTVVVTGGIPATPDRMFMSMKLGDNTYDWVQTR